MMFGNARLHEDHLSTLPNMTLFNPRSTIQTFVMHLEIL